MSFFTNKKFLFKLIATICLFLTIFNFCLPPKARAESTLSKVGGQILDPFVSLLCALGDGVMEIIQNSIMGTSATAIFDNTKEAWWVKAGKLILGVILVTVAAVLLTGATLAAIAAVAVKIAIGAVIVNVVTDGAVMSVISSLGAAYFSDSVVFPMFTIGPEEIFSGRILLFDPNIFDPEQVYVRFVDNKSDDKTLEEWNEESKNPNTNLTSDDIEKYYYIDDDGNEVATSTNNSAYQLKDIISKWYYVIRNIAIVGLMLVLMYVGIRMLLSTIASEKAKYKQMLFDWLVAMCLVFVLHYFMVFANHFVDNIVSIFASTTETKMHVVAIKDGTDKLKEAVEDVNPDYVTDDGTILWPTNMMGKIRLESQQYTGESKYIGYGLCYVVLVFYTAFFTFTYLKRLLYLMFLTVIAPLVALSYPLDKIRDGNAQAFEMWMKEYIINLLIQPFHLLLYVIFVTMAFDLAGTNTIYSLVVIGFMIPAEKFLRKMFGFDRASSPGFLAGAAGAAMTISAVQSLAKFASGGKGSNKQGGGGNNDKIPKTQNNETDDSSDNSMQDLLDSTVSGDNGNDPQLPPSNQDDDEQIDFTNDNGEITLGSVLKGSAQLAGRGIKTAAGTVKDLADKGRDFIDEKKDALEQKINRAPKFVGYGYARLKNMAKNNLTKEKFRSGAKKTIRGVAKYGLGATGAMLGIAAGVASGSPGDALKYGIGGAYAASSVGAGMSDRIGAGISSMASKEEQAHEDAMREQLGEEEFKKWKQEKTKKAYINDVEERRKIAKEFNLKKKKDMDEMMEQAWEYKKRPV